MDIMIKYDVIYHNVDIETAYIGAKSLSEQTDYDRMRTLRADRNLLKVFVDDATGKLTAGVGKYILSVENGGDGVCLAMDVRDGLEAGITRMLYAFYTDYVLERWYMILGLDRETDSAYANRGADIGQLASEIHSARPEKPGKIASPRRISIF